MLRKIKSILSYTDYYTLGLSVIIATIGIVLIYSAGYDPSSKVVAPFYQRQLIWLCLGLTLFWLMSWINYRKLISYAPVIYCVGLTLLLLVDILGYIGMGAKRWLDIGFIRIQPSELFKSIWIITLAWIFIDFDTTMFNLKKILKKSLLLIPPFLLVFLQPDLGTALIFLFVWSSILIILGIRKKSMLFIILAILVVMPIGWSNLHDYQKNRVLTFLDPERDPFGTGYHVIQSKIGIGSGGINGKGYLEGTQSHLRFIPERHTDFIFSVINEEFGLIGGTTILILFMLLLFRLVQTAIVVKEAAGKLLILGVTANIFIQFTINSYMTVGFMPVVGIPMPFLSYGGSSLMSFFIMLGMVNSVYIRRYHSGEDKITT